LATFLELFFLRQGEKARVSLLSLFSIQPSKNIKAMEPTLSIYAKNVLILSLLLVATNCTLSQESSKSKCQSKYFELAASSTANHNQYFARRVHYRRWDNHGFDYEYDYRIVCNKDKNNPYCAIVSDNETIVLKKGCYIVINHAHRELTNIRKKWKGRIYYPTMRYNVETQHHCLHYYMNSVPKMKPMFMPKIKSCMEETVNGKKSLKYVASDTWQGHSSDEARTKMDLCEETEYWINPSTLEMDSVVCVTTHNHENGASIVVTAKEYVSNDEAFDFESFEKLLDFNNPKYMAYSRHDENDLPYSMRGTRTKEMTETLKAFPIVNMSGQTTSIGELEGWVLLDFWGFGCPSCFEQFKNYAQEIDSIGTTVLEQNNVAVLCIHPSSDNMEMIGKIGEKYRISKYLYSAKGMNTQLDMIGFPTYYLVSPNKQLVLKTNRLADYSEILMTIKNHK